MSSERKLCPYVTCLRGECPVEKRQQVDPTGCPALPCWAVFIGSPLAFRKVLGQVNENLVTWAGRQAEKMAARQFNEVLVDQLVARWTEDKKENWDDEYVNPAGPLRSRAQGHLGHGAARGAPLRESSLWRAEAHLPGAGRYDAQRDPLSDTPDERCCCLA